MDRMTGEIMASPVNLGWRSSIVADGLQLWDARIAHSVLFFRASVFAFGTNQFRSTPVTLNNNFVGDDTGYPSLLVRRRRVAQQVFIVVRC